jgi:hypothetical protein
MQNNICFGIDEYFLNAILFKYLLKNNKPFCYKVLFDMAQFFYFKNPNVINFNYIDIGKDEYIKIFNEYMKYIKFDKLSFDEIDKNIYVGTDFLSSHKVTPFMRKYARRIIRLIKHLDKIKDYRIYTKSQIYSLLNINYKKYYYLEYIQFINFESENMNITEIAYDKE